MIRAIKTVALLRKNGIDCPWIAYRAAKRGGLELAVLCAVLDQETGGGQNVFGHDPTIFIGAGRVTKAKYLEYRAMRRATGKMQGVGPMQLTWYSYQDAADALGGCWKPRWNVAVGVAILDRAVKRSGLYAALRAYNGSDTYAVKVMVKVHKWRRILESV